MADPDSTADHALPGYHDATSSSAPPPRPPPPSQSVPSKSGSALETVHKYSLETGKGKAWVTLEVKSRAANEKNLPLFVSGDEIAGVVSFNLDKSESLKGIVLSVTGGTTAVGQEEERFLELSQELSPAAKLKGAHSFPFKLALPTECTPKGEKQTWPLPPTMSERASPAYIDYKLTVVIKRGALRVNQTLGTSFSYLPRSRPDPPSLLREAAYREGVPLIGPDGDAEGWKVLKPLKIQGTIFDTREVEVECTLAIATPLAYAIGTPIPLHLTFTSSDTQALDLLANPRAPQCFLVRTHAVGSGATDVTAPRRSNNTFLEECGKAVWWPVEEETPAQVAARGEKNLGWEKEGSDGGKGSKRVLMGELEVRKGLKASFSFPKHCVWYSIALRSFTAPGFTYTPPAVGSSSSAGSEEFLLTERVTITTVPAAGPSPRAYAPPGYRDENNQGDYNTAIGFLENGNQRFYHHHGGTGWAP
ncbi:hypothetical protein PUNSTDRAFT_133646 [Punctularia strigosozonata HHB-11173 SS5]|uniref:uncharacterized protein n=1 Tax=Punctularia strigosozonata (strain HHB-11173) TaxID=741275 RepID=UPI00044165E3|nr:uncharacterized protein PUNSTDRAFT_133646 [Punctularia strigosozonata HHB-11173 SS5]EIN09874.1 hypothetical protein PUNSTDRAFT_133646 [Punctularia strigosozonata HHB-11173 SS5]